MPNPDKIPPAVQTGKPRVAASRRCASVLPFNAGTRHINSHINPPQTAPSAAHFLAVTAFRVGGFPFSN